jgi:hypothetical protein
MFLLFKILFVSSWAFSFLYVCSFARDRAKVKKSRCLLRMSYAPARHHTGIMGIFPRNKRTRQANRSLVTNYVPYLCTEVCYGVSFYIVSKNRANFFGNYAPHPHSSPYKKRGSRLFLTSYHSERKTPIIHHPSPHGFTISKHADHL